MPNSILSGLPARVARLPRSRPSIGLGILRQSRSIQTTDRIGLDSPFIKVSEEVRDAVHRAKPVVALESTIYTHGFPYPENTALASRLESVVRLHGGTPATIGILNGIARIGLSAEQLIELTTSAGKPETKKVSRRDLPYVLGTGCTGKGLNGGTTVSATMLLASWANIKVFATGGLGGVHRGGEHSMDISADLTELGRTKIAVVSSGCKSFLDIPRTLEYLETQGTSVSTFRDGRNGDVDFPAFWTRESGTRSPLTIKDETEAAGMIYAQRSTPIESGILFANPIPAEHSILKSEMDLIMDQALQDAEASGSLGNDITPHVLKRIREITQGRSVTANRALVEANVARGTKIAVQVEKLLQSRVTDRSAPAFPSNQVTSNQAKGANPVSQNTTSDVTTFSQPSKGAADVLVAGSLAIDLSCDFVPQGQADASSKPTFHTSNPASIEQSLGGVGQNIAIALQYLGTSVRLCTKIGDDVAGSAALEMLNRQGLQTSGIEVAPKGHHTAQYVALNDSQKNLVIAMADMSVLEDTTGDFGILWKSHFDDCRPRWVVLDANWEPATLSKWLDAAKDSKAKVAYEPVSVAKSIRIFGEPGRNVSPLPAVPNHAISLATPNALELAAMHEAASVTGALDRDDWWRIIDSLGLSSSGSRERLISLTSTTLVDQGIPQQAIRLLPFIPCILTTLGKHGVLMTRLLQPEDDQLTSPVSAPYILSRSTGGNALVGGVYMRLFKPTEQVPEENIVSVNGVGDTFLGVLIAGLAKEMPKPIEFLLDIAQKGSVMTLKSKEAVSPELAILKSAL